jgi:hypothetical protein
MPSNSTGWKAASGIAIPPLVVELATARGLELPFRDLGAAAR